MKINNLAKMFVLVFICLAVSSNLPAMAGEKPGMSDDETMVKTYEKLAQKDEQQELTDEELARLIANPIVAMYILPLQSNYEQNIGPKEDGTRYTINIQPILPFHLSKDWNLIMRPIVPVIFQDDIFPGAGSQSGLGDTLLNFYFSPVAPTAGGSIWGLGPTFLLPTGTDDLLTGEKWGVGPTGVWVRQRGGLTYGFLATHLCSFAGDDDRADVNTTLFQPMAAYTSKSAFTYILQLEYVYDWENEDSSAPLMAMVSKVTRIGGQAMSFALGVRYYLDSMENGADGFAFRFNITFLFPRL